MYSTKGDTISFLKKDGRLFLFFIAYGLGAGVLSYVSTLSYEDSQMDAIATIANLPTFLLIFMTNPSGFSIDPSIFPVAIIAASGAVWSAVGMLVYAFIRLFRLGP